LNAERAPQLKASVGLLRSSTENDVLARFMGRTILKPILIFALLCVPLIVSCDGGSSFKGTVMPADNRLPEQSSLLKRRHVPSRMK